MVKSASSKHTIKATFLVGVMFASFNTPSPAYADCACALRSINAGIRSNTASTVRAVETLNRTVTNAIGESAAQVTSTLEVSAQADSARADMIEAMDRQRRIEAEALKKRLETEPTVRVCENVTGAKRTQDIDGVWRGKSALLNRGQSEWITFEDSRLQKRQNRAMGMLKSSCAFATTFDVLSGTCEEVAPAEDKGIDINYGAGIGARGVLSEEDVRLGFVGKMLLWMQGGTGIDAPNSEFAIRKPEAMQALSKYKTGLARQSVGRYSFERSVSKREVFDAPELSAYLLAVIIETKNAVRDNPSGNGGAEAFDLTDEEMMMLLDGKVSQSVAERVRVWAWAFNPNWQAELSTKSETQILTELSHITAYGQYQTLETNRLLELIANLLAVQVLKESEDTMQEASAVFN